MLLARGRERARRFDAALEQRRRRVLKCTAYKVRVAPRAADALDDDLPTDIAARVAVHVEEQERAERVLVLERQALGQRRRRGRGDARALGRGLGVAPARQAYEERVRLRVEDFRALDLRLDDVARAAAVPVAPAHAALGEGLAPQRRDVAPREAVRRVRAELERELACLQALRLVRVAALRCRLR